MTEIWLTSDHHFGHTNVIKYCSRPFSSVEEMDEQLISNHNEVVGKKDTVYHLGDFSFKDAASVKEIMERMNGKFTVIKGNHDYWARKLKISIDNLQDTLDYKELKHNKRKFILFHYPIQNWRDGHHGSIHFHGHSHGECSNDGRKRMDVGVDPQGYYPVPLTELLIDMIDSWKPTEHHK